MSRRGRVLSLISFVGASAALYVQGCTGDDPDSAAPPDGGLGVEASLTDVATTDVATADTGADASGGDAALDADSGPAPACDATKAFAAPEEVVELSISTLQGGARLTPDMKTVFFHAALDGGPAVLHQATRSTVPGTFGNIMPIPGLQTLDSGAPAQAAYPTLSNDGLSIYFESNRGGPVRIWYATRANTSAAFGEPVLVDALTDPQNTGQPFLPAGGSTLYLISRRLDASAGGLDIFTSVISAPGMSNGFTHVPELSTAQDDFTPTTTPNGLTILFARLMLEDGGVAATKKVWSATRAQVTAPFSNLKPETTLWSDGDDLPTWISADGCTVFLQSSRDGTMKIFSATRPK